MSGRHFSQPTTPTRKPLHSLHRAAGSAFGSNITDVTLVGKDGTSFLVVRPDNFNERLGAVRAQDVAVVVGNVPEGEGGSTSPLHPITLKEYLQRAGDFGHYAGVPAGTSLYDADADAKVGIRFQVVFLPVGEDGAVEMYNTAYNYQTRSAEDPKNVILLGTTQGTFLQQDGPGTVPQYLHRADEDSPSGYTCTYLEALRTRHGVSMEQKETKEEAEAAAAAGKATAGVIGIRSMGKGFNRLMTVQVPLKQVAPLPSFPECGAACIDESDGSVGGYGSDDECDDECVSGFDLTDEELEGTSAPTRVKAARVSHGSDAGPMTMPASTNWVRDPSCAINITVQFYFVVEAGTTIAEGDIKAAIDLCEAALAGCDEDGKLMDEGMWWMRD